MASLDFKGCRKVTDNAMLPILYFVRTNIWVAGNENNPRL